MTPTEVAAPPTGSADLEATLSSEAFVEDANAEETHVEETPARRVADPSTESEQPLEESTETEEVSAGEESGESEEQDGDEEAEEPSAYHLMLPRQQRKDYPEELYQLAAKELGIPPEKLSEPWVKATLKAQINSDIREQAFNESQAATEGVEEEEPAETAADEETRTPLSPGDQMKFADEYAASLVTDEGAALYAQAQNDAWTKLNEAIATDDKEGIAKAQKDVTRSQLAFLTVALSRMFPDFLQRSMSQLPKETWKQGVGTVLNEQSEIRDSHREARGTVFKDPRYGAEAQRLVESGAVLKALEQHPEIAEKQFVDANGRKLSPAANIAAQYRFVIDLIRGQNYKRPMELVKKATAAGEKHARDVASKKALGRLQPGRSTGQMNRPGTGDQQWVDRAKKQAAQDSPLSAFSGR